MWCPAERNLALFAPNGAKNRLECAKIDPAGGTPISATSFPHAPTRPVADNYHPLAHNIYWRFQDNQNTHRGTRRGASPPRIGALTAPPYLPKAAKNKIFALCHFFHARMSISRNE